MNPLGSHKILSFYHEAKQILSGHIPPPRMVSFWPTTICNYNCSFCLYKHENREDHHVADTASTLRMIDDISRAGVKSLEFSGGGEPTLHPDFEKIAEHAIDCGLKLGLFTNGTNLDMDILKDFRYVRIGLDAADYQTYEDIKRPRAKNAFETVCDNIRRFVKTKNGFTRPRIGVKFLLNNLNHQDTGDMLELGADLGVGYVQFKAEHNGPNTMDKKQVQMCEEQIVYERDMMMHDVDVFGSVLPRTENVKCFLSPTHTVIDPQGNCFVCCFLRTPEYIIGNVFDRNFADFWGKNRHKDIVSSLTATTCSAWDCRWRRYNKIMEDVIVGDDLDIDFV